MEGNNRTELTNKTYVIWRKAKDRGKTTKKNTNNNNEKTNNKKNTNKGLREC